MATIDEYALKNIGLWWRYGISRHCDEWKCIIIGRIFESEMILKPPSLKISESSFNGSYRNTDEVWWRYGISRSCDEWYIYIYKYHHAPKQAWQTGFLIQCRYRLSTDTYILYSGVVILNIYKGNPRYNLFVMVANKFQTYKQRSTPYF